MCDTILFVRMTYQKEEFHQVLEIDPIKILPILINNDLLWMEFQIMTFSEQFQ